jgi:hypothetical protein
LKIFTPILYDKYKQTEKNFHKIKVGALGKPFTEKNFQNTQFYIHPLLLLKKISTPDWSENTIFCEITENYFYVLILHILAIF